ncbi:hypothetical protein GCM10010360_58640 [Streptomyces nogalater]
MPVRRRPAAGGLTPRSSPGPVSRTCDTGPGRDHKRIARSCGALPGAPDGPEADGPRKGRRYGRALVSVPGAPPRRGPRHARVLARTAGTEAGDGRPPCRLACSPGDGESFGLLGAGLSEDGTLPPVPHRHGPGSAAGHRRTLRMALRR